MKYFDKSCYQFHVDDIPDTCFLCRHGTKHLFIVRHLVTGKMVHLCENCMVEKASDYLLDNTRPWTCSGKRRD